MDILNFEVFLFDLDGVIIDSEKIHYECYKESISKYTTYKLTWDKYCEIHHSADNNFNILFPEFYSQIYIYKQELYKNRINEIQLINGFEQFFNILIQNGKKICIVTDALQETVNIIVNKFIFLKKVNLIISRNEIQNRKPNSECYLNALKLYLQKYELNEIIAFEDSYKGWLAVNQVVYNCVLINNVNYFYYTKINALNSMNDFKYIDNFKYTINFEMKPFYISSKTIHRDKWLSLQNKFPIIACWIHKNTKKEDMSNDDKNALCSEIHDDINISSFGILYVENGEYNHIGSLIEIGILISQNKKIYVCGNNIFKNEVLFNFKNIFNFNFVENFNLNNSFLKIQYDNNPYYIEYTTRVKHLCNIKMTNTIENNKNIDYVVISASGKGTRLMPLTKHIPKLLVSNNSNNLLYNIITYWRQYTNKIVIIIDSQYNEIVIFYMNLLCIEYEIINVNCKHNEENSYTIHNALKDTKYTNKKILLTWCDIYPKSIINNYIFADKNIIFTYKDFGRYDAYDNTVIKKTNGNIIGIYYFHNFTHLIDFENHMDICDCYKANFGDFITHEIDELIDIGDYTKLIEYINSNEMHFKTRFFNNIYETENNTLIKQSTCSYGDIIIENEMSFYKFHDISNIPKIIKYNYNSFEMEKINGEIAIDVFNKSRIPSQFKLLQNIIDNLKLLHEQRYCKIEQTNLINDIDIEFNVKIVTRLDNITPLLRYFNFIKSVNGKLIKYDHSFIINKLYNKIKTYFINNVDSYNSIHGDPHLSNIIIDTNGKICFIDPRGYFGNSKLFGIKHYDISKIIYSLSGFDTLNNNPNHFFIIDNHNIDVNITNNMKNYIFLFEEYNIELLIDMTILHWFGLTDYSKNNIHKCISSYYYAIYLYHDYYSEAECRS